MKLVHLILATTAVLLAMACGDAGSAAPGGSGPGAATPEGGGPGPSGPVSTPAAAGAGLASLTISGATLSPSFSPSVTRYTAAVDVMSKDPFTITPTAKDAQATIAVNGAPLLSGIASKPIRIIEQRNVVDVAVTVPGGPTTHYTILAAAAQDAYVKASNTRATSYFGQGVALAGDLMAIGSWGESSGASGIDGDQNDTSAPNAGAVYIFRRFAGVWTQEAYVKASNTRAQAHFGIRVVLSGDTLAVGAFNESSGATGIDGDQADTSAPRAGAVYIFKRTPCLITGGTSGTSGTSGCCQPWSQQAYIKASNTQPDAEFGTAVALDGDTLVVGASGERSNATGVGGDQADRSLEGAGSAYVFTRTGETWSQQAYLKASNTRALALFGSTATVSGDTLAIDSIHESSGATGVGGNQADTSAPGGGAVYVFTRTGGAWSQQAYLKASNTNASSNVTGGFGISMSLSGETLAVGSYVEASAATGVNGDPTDTSTLNAGAVYVFARTGAAWSQQAYVKAPNTRSLALFGYSVALFADTMVIGSVNESSNAIGIDGNLSDTSMPNAGGAYVYKRAAGVWIEQAYMKASNTRTDALFGYSVAIDNDRIAIGSRFESSAATGIGGNQADTSAPIAGSVYVFR